MQKNLVIVESPAKAKTIEKFLGKDFKVMSSYGHIRDLKKKNFGVDLDTFEPEYEIPADKQKVVSDLRSQARKSEKVWLASDEDREGEAISWHLAEVLNLEKSQKNRIVFHEITKPAIVKAIENPRSIDLNLVDAQQARRVLDRLVGFKISPILWRRVRPSLSAGRVQSVAVRLIVEREREIAAFRSESSYHVSAVFLIDTPDGAATLKADLRRNFDTKEKAREFLESCKGASFVIKNIAVRPAKRTPAPPFTTSTLQQEAARRLGFPVATTMRVAQSLYESGLITYMRTDSMNLSDLCLNTCGPVIAGKMGVRYHKMRRYHTHTKGAQEAHEAIRPTDVSRQTVDRSPQEKRLYELIWKRTLACQMADAELERTTVEIAADGLDDVFVATCEVVKFDGFLKLYHDAEENAEEASALLPPMSEGQQAMCGSIAAQQRFTLHPPRYNEGTLVHKLEELGIGRPSTYATTISTIQQREYVVKDDRPGEKRDFNVLTLADGEIADEMKSESAGAERNKLFPTDVGIVVNDFLTDHFSEILDYNFTANVEKDFDNVAEGKQDWTQLIRDFYEKLAPQVEKSLNEKSEHRIGERQLGTDPASGRMVSVKIGRFGPMVQVGLPDEDEKPRFASLKSGQSIETITLEEALELFRLPRDLGEHEGERIIVNTGRFGPYVMYRKTFASIPKDIDPLAITREQALGLIEEKMAAKAKKFIKSFDEDPEMQILNGRFGPYISYKKANYKLPADLHDRAAELTLEECLKVVKDDAKKPKRTYTRRRK